MCLGVKTLLDLWHLLGTMPMTSCDPDLEYYCDVYMTFVSYRRYWFDTSDGGSSRSILVNITSSLDIHHVFVKLAEFVVQKLSERYSDKYFEFYFLNKSLKMPCTYIYITCVCI